MKTLPQLSKKPRVTNALQPFGEANKDAIGGDLHVCHILHGEEATSDH